MLVFAFPVVSLPERQSTGNKPFCTVKPPDSDAIKTILSRGVTKPRRVHLYTQTDRQRIGIYLLAARDFVMIRVGCARPLAIRRFNSGRIRENQSAVEPRSNQSYNVWEFTEEALRWL